MTESITADHELQADLLHFALENAADDPPLDMRAFSDQYGYDYQKVRDAVDELYPLLEYGSGAGAPWIGHNQLPAIKDQLRQWGVLR